MTALAAQIEFRLRARWVSDTLQETNKVVKAEKTAEGDPAGTLEPLAVAILELFSSFEKSWRRFLGVLEEKGASSQFVCDLIGDARTLIAEVEQVIDVLAPRGKYGELEEVIKRLPDIKKHIKAIESATVFPEFDPERLQRRLEECQLDEGEDIEGVIARAKAGAAV